MIPEQAPLVILDGKSDLCMVNNFSDTKHNTNISSRIQLVTNVEELNLNKTVWCVEVMQLSDIGPKDFREDDLILD